MAYTSTFILDNISHGIIPSTLFMKEKKKLGNILPHNSNSFTLSLDLKCEYMYFPFEAWKNKSGKLYSILEHTHTFQKRTLQFYMPHWHWWSDISSFKFMTKVKIQISIQTAEVNSISYLMV